ncbi:PQQ-dependent sugar dehydrogenase [Luteimonas pelagia]
MRWTKGMLAGCVLAATAVTGCGGSARLSVRDGTGPTPVLPAPDPERIPTVNIAPAVGWLAGQAPVPAAGFAVEAYATGLEHPRWLHVLPNGDVLVAETNRQPKEPEGVRDRVMGALMARAGAAVPSPDRITLLRDANRNGKVDARHVFLDGLRSPFGMALVGDTLYVANTDAVMAYPYSEGDTSITAPGRRLAALPEGPRNHHWTKSLVASPDGAKLYVGVGSNSNIAEHGMAEEADRAAILEVDVATGATRVFASGLRNPVGVDFHPDTGVLWTVVNERDALGPDLVPDYLTSVRDGGFYGWPWSYFGQHVDERVEPARPDMVARAIAPEYALGPHTASLGLAFYDGDLLPARYRHGAFIGQHGSWNRKPHSGYKLVFVPFAGGRPAGPMEDVLTGFLDARGDARGRPVGVAVAADGAVLLADDVGNVVWRVLPAAPGGAAGE